VGSPCARETPAAWGSRGSRNHLFAQEPDTHIMTPSNGKVNSLSLRDQILQQIESYENKTRSMLAECQDLTQVKRLGDEVETLRVYAKKMGLDSRHINRLTILRGDTQRALGGLTKPIPPALFENRSKSVNSGDTVSPESRIAVLADAGIGKKTAQRCESVAAIPDDRWEEIRQSAADDDREWSSKDLYRIGRQYQLAEAKDAWQADEQLAGSVELVHQGALDFLPTLAEASVDLILTDPPYSTDVPNVEEFARDWLGLALSRVKPTGRAYIFIGSYPMEIHAYLDAFYNPFACSPPHAMRLDMILPWVYRNTLGPSTKDSYKLNWQACLYFIGPDAGPLDCDVLTEKFSVQDINAPDGRHGLRLHPWQKPDEIAERFIRHSTSPGQTVLDPFAGTGTFLAAAARLGRNAIGCEIDEEMLSFCKQRGLLA
jgi:site-specific DNA-methyltransferase (adenine-specific)